MVLHQHVSNFQQRHFGGKTQNISAYPRPMGVFGTAWLEREAKAQTFFEDSQMQSIGQCMLALWNFNIIYPHSDMKLLSASRFGRVPSL